MDNKLDPNLCRQCKMKVGKGDIHAAYVAVSGITLNALA